MIITPRRMRLRRADDGQVYLDRWGFETPLGGLYLHRISAPDPGASLHDHPWPFLSLVLRGGYDEVVADTRRPAAWHYASRMAGSVHAMRLDRCHRIVDCAPGTWTLVLFGRRARDWGFYTGRGWVSHSSYNTEQRELLIERGTDSK